jgi:hypothetical protein
MLFWMISSIIDYIPYALKRMARQPPWPSCSGSFGFLVLCNQPYENCRLAVICILLCSHMSLQAELEKCAATSASRRRSGASWSGGCSTSYGGWPTISAGRWRPLPPSGRSTGTASCWSPPTPSWSASSATPASLRRGGAAAPLRMR